MWIDWVDTIFTPALVEDFSHVQGLNRKNVFIKVTPAIIILTQLMNRGRLEVIEGTLRTFLR